MNKRPDWLQARKAWKAAFRDMERNPNRGPHNQRYWEGKVVYLEAKRRKMLPFVKLTRRVTKEGVFKGASDQRVRAVCTRLEEAVAHYHQELQLLQRMPREKDLVAWVAEKRREFLKVAGQRHSTPELARSLHSIVKILDRIDEELRDETGERRWRVLHRGTFNRFRPEPTFSRTIPQQRREIDTRFICEFGSQLRFWLPTKQLSLRAIARLIILAFVSLGIATKETNEVLMTETGTRLSVAEVYQKLRRAKLH